MKVATPGLLVFQHGRLLITGWVFDCEGGPQPTLEQVAECALQFVATTNGLELGAQPEPRPTFEVERIAFTATAIAAAKAPRPRGLRARLATFLGRT